VIGVGACAEIISSGRELLIGKTINTNSTWLASQLSSICINVTRISAVGDRIYDISRAISESIDRMPDVIFITGGLGPTYDDLTLEAVSSALGITKTINSEAHRLVSSKYRLMNAEMTPSRIKMANMPEGSMPIVNSIGTAPGVSIDHRGIRIFCLPGVPSEMKAMFQSVMNELALAPHAVFEGRSFILEGVAESALSPVIDEWRSSHPGIYVKSHPRGRESVPTLEIHLSAMGADHERLRNELKSAEASFYEMAQKIGGRLRRSGS